MDNTQEKISDIIDQLMKEMGIHSLENLANTDFADKLYDRLIEKNIIPKTVDKL
jgi:hypothetical protein